MSREFSLPRVPPTFLPELEIDGSLQDLSGRSAELGRQSAVYCTREVYQQYCETPDGRDYLVYDLLESMFHGIIDGCARIARTHRPTATITFRHWVSAAGSRAEPKELQVQMYRNKAGVVWLKISCPGGAISSRACQPLLS